MLVKCKCCSQRIDKNNAYKVVIKDKNEYYCTLNEFVKMNEEKENRLTLLKTIDDIFGYTITNTTLSKELSGLANIYTYTKILSYLQDKLDDITKFMNKDFSSEYGKIRYFTTILKNNLRDYKPNVKEDTFKETNIEIYESKFVPKKRKKSISDYIEETEG